MASAPTSSAPADAKWAPDKKRRAARWHLGAGGTIKSAMLLVIGMTMAMRMTMGVNADGDFFVKLRRDETQNTPSVNGTSVNGSCVINASLIYDVDIRAGKKNVDRFGFQLEFCESANDTTCEPISKTFPRCGRVCSEENEFEGSFRMRGYEETDESEPYIKVDLKLSKQRHFAQGVKRDFHFRMRMKNLESGVITRSEFFSVSVAKCPEDGLTDKIKNWFTYWWNKIDRRSPTLNLEV